MIRVHVEQPQQFIVNIIQGKFMLGTSTAGALKRIQTIFDTLYSTSKIK